MQSFGIGCPHQSGFNDTDNIMFYKSHIHADRQILKNIKCFTKVVYIYLPIL